MAAPVKRASDPSATRTCGVPLLPRGHPAVRQIARAWRDLAVEASGTAARGSLPRTVIACSAGPDSALLAIAMASALSGPKRAGTLVIAHVRHDLRSASETRADAAAARALAQRLGVPFVLTRVRVRGAGAAGTTNLEARARALRYAALGRIARRHRCELVATAHHANDQLETVLMRLVRGTGLHGLVGIRAGRWLDDRRPRVRLVRPMLVLARGEIDGALAAALADSEWSPRVDATNADTTRLRSRLRHQVVPTLEEAAPGAAQRAVALGQLLADAGAPLRRRARGIVRGAEARVDSLSVSTALLRAEGVYLMGLALREMHRRLTGGRGLDRLRAGPVRQAARAILGQPGLGPKRFDWPGCTLRVNKLSVVLVRRAD